MPPSSKERVRSFLLGAAGILLLGLISWGARHAYDAWSLGAARARFGRAVAPLPANRRLRRDEEAAREQALWRRAGVARLAAAPAGLQAVRAALARSPAEWSEAEMGQVRQLVAAHRGSLQAAHRAADQAADDPGPPRRPAAAAGADPPPPWVPRGPDPLIAQANLQATLLRAEIGLALRDHAPAEALPGLRALAAEAAAFQAEPVAMFQLVGAGLESRMLQCIAWIVQDEGAASADLEAIERVLPRQAPASAIARMLAAEAAYELQVIDSRPLRERLSGHDEAALLDGMRRFAVRSQQPYSEARRALRESAPPPSQATTVPELFLPLLLPNFESAIVQLKANGASRELARLGIALRLAAARRCAYPADLAALPAAAPDPLTGRQPVYAREPSGGARLALPTAGAVFRAELVNPGLAPPPFDWRLPPPCRKTVAGR
jgi:hypothetical protein